MKRIVTGIMFALLLTSMLTLVSNIQPVKASGTIYIRADGSIDPPTANITSANNITYTFTDNNYDQIVIERNNIVVDGNGHTLLGSGVEDSIGMDLRYRSNVTIKNTRIENFWIGIRIDYSSSISVAGNDVMSIGRYGILIWSSSDNNISGNNVTNHAPTQINNCGIYLGSPCTGNNISANNITASNWGGVYIDGVSKNRFSGNVFVGDGLIVGYMPTWDNIVENNLVNDKNLVYLEDASDLVVEDAGQVILVNCSGITVQNLNLSNTSVGVELWESTNSTITGNTITETSMIGIFLQSSSGNNISENNITNNAYYGIQLWYSSNNKLYHNNIIHNTIQALVGPSGYSNLWDDGYPSGGNYWSNYTGVDEYSGPNQDRLGSDGTGDKPYVIDADNRDRYPLMVQWRARVYYDWPMFHHDLNHTGYSISGAPNTNQTLWTYTIGIEVWTSPVVAYGQVYVAIDKVYALNASNGEHIWNYTMGLNSESLSAAVADGRVYVGSNYGKVYALNASNGEHIWNCTFGGAVGTSSPAVADGRVYIGVGYDGRIYALNATTGEHIWNYTTGRIFSSPAVADDKVYVSGGYNVYCLNASSGAFIWSYATGGEDMISSPAVADGRVYIGSSDGKIYCLDTATGTHIWNYTTGNAIWSSPAIAYGKVYVGSLDNIFYALNASTGEHIWNYTTGSLIVRSSAAIADGKVFIGSCDCRVYALNASTGSHIWSYTTDNAVDSSPVVAYGNVYVGSDDGNVYAFADHDIAVKDLYFSKTVVGNGYSMSIKANIVNEGPYAEKFNMTAYANTTEIQKKEITLTSGTSTTITFPWNTSGFAKGNYTIKAVADTLPEEMDTDDNSFTDGWVIVAMAGDITGPDGWPDGACEMRDIRFVAKRFGVDPASPLWNSNADVIEDNFIDMKDIRAVAKHFGEIDP